MAVNIKIKGATNGLSQNAALNEHKMAVTRNYISQPRLSKFIGIWVCMVLYNIAFTLRLFEIIIYNFLIHELIL